MKKWIAIIIIFLLVTAAAIYLLIPSPLRISNSFALKISPDAAYRTLVRQDQWDSREQGTVRITQRLLNTVQMDVIDKDLTIAIQLLLIPAGSDSVIISWESVLPVVKSPIAKFRQYLKAKNIKIKIDTAFSRFGSFIQKNENVYGFNIKETSTKDTLLLATRFTTTSYPSTEEIYLHIGKLKTFAQKAKASQTGFPMLNVTKVDSTFFRCMAALPVDKIVDGSEPVFFVRMVAGKFLTTEVVGGYHTIARGHDVIQLYYEDYKRSAMAIPFEYMVTDRKKETDTSRWITRIYGPVK